MLKNHIAKAILAPTDGSFRLADYDPAWCGLAELRGLTEKRLKKSAKNFLEERRERLRGAQEKLYADGHLALLVIFQAMDAAGKDTTIKHVMSGVNPQGCQVTSFKHPTAQELDHDFMWRYAHALPERGRIGIFNRSYYEDVLIVRVHPELIDRQRLPGDPRKNGFWRARYDIINGFERHLTRNGTVIVKFFLNMSKDEQKKRFIERLTDREKLWKYAPADLRERGFWPQYQKAYQDAIAATSTPWAPWHVIPADNKWVMRALVGDIVAETIEALDIDFPKLAPERRAELRRALRALRDERGD